eukprot:2162879-Ditylum_brightwellii.AAC.1
MVQSPTSWKWSLALFSIFVAPCLVNTQGWTIQSLPLVRVSCHVSVASKAIRKETTHLRDSSSGTKQYLPMDKSEKKSKQRVMIIGAGWGDLLAANALANEDDIEITVVKASPCVGGLVRDGFTSLSGNCPAEAGQHGFWNNYHNIYWLFDQLAADENLDFDTKTALTSYAKQGQYSPDGLKAVWPVYRDQALQLPTGLAQA